MRERGPSLAKTMKNVSPICLSPHPLKTVSPSPYTPVIFAVFMPEEPHQALCAIGTATSIRKAVFKVPRDMLEA